MIATKRSGKVPQWKPQTTTQKDKVFKGTNAVGKTQEIFVVPTSMQQVQMSPQWTVYCKVRELEETNYRTPAAIEYQRTLTCYECGGLGHYKRDYPELKNQNHGNQAGSTEAREMVHALGGMGDLLPSKT
ncbi:reverse transcriptase domain-containing protein [Tanacetum coccineum]